MIRCVRDDRRVGVSGATHQGVCCLSRTRRDKKRATQCGLVGRGANSGRKDQNTEPRIAYGSGLDEYAVDPMQPSVQ